MTLHFKNVLISKSVSYSKLKKPSCVYKKNNRTKLRSPSKEEPARDLSIQSSFRDKKNSSNYEPNSSKQPPTDDQKPQKGRSMWCRLFPHLRVQLIATGGGKNAAWMVIEGLIITATA